MSTTTIYGPQSLHAAYSRIPSAPREYKDTDFNQIIDIIGQNFDTIGNPTTQVSSETLVQIQTSSFTVDASSGLNLIDTTGGAITATLQSAALFVGRAITFKRITAGANNITIAAAGGQTIDGAASINMPTQWQTRVLKSTGNPTGGGAAWIIVSSYL